MRINLLSFTMMLRWIFCVTLISFVAGALRTATIDYLPTTSETELKESCGVCLTEGCVDAAAEVNNKLNKSADPCNSFFDFACGNFLHKTIIPDEKTSVTSFSVINDKLRENMRLLVEEDVRPDDPISFKKAKTLFQSCMNKEYAEELGLKPLQEVLSELGGWPAVEGDLWDGSNFSWIETNYKHRKLGYSMDYIFDFSVSTDIRNSTWRMIWLDQPSLGMTREYLMKGLNDSDVRAYLKYSVETAVLLGADRSRAQAEMEETLKFQIKLAEISLPREQRRNMTKLYNTMPISEVQSLFPDLPWVEYINNILPNNITIDETERVGISDPTYFTNLTKILSKTDNRVIANYMLWRVAAGSASYLSKDIRNLQQEFSKVLTGKEVRSPRWKECMGILTSRMSYATGSLYVSNYFNEEAKAQAENLVLYVRDEFDRVLHSVKWMDDATRTKALEKAKAIKAHIGYPQELKNHTILNDYYNDLVINSNDSLLQNIRASSLFSINNSFKKLRLIVDKLDWKRQGSAAAVNAYYSSIENSIKFPAGILQGTFFEPNRPKYMNFGGIAYVIGHEITHGFDDQGKQFNAVGNLVNWWDPTTELNFLKRAQCIIKQYGNYINPEIGLKLNGINTQGENIADNGGIKQAYNAYNTWVKHNGPEPLLPSLPYTPKQMFWISAAQVWCSKYRPQALKHRILTGVHSPGRFRVNGPFSNSVGFAADWNCPSGSNMNPKDKCVIW